MEKDDNHARYIAHLLENLNDQSMSLIDFDRLTGWLQQISSELTTKDNLACQLKMLRDDYSQRIAGMVKAIAAVDRKKDAGQEALTLVDSLSSMNTSQLVDCYRKASARFRDCFPASFGLLRQPRPQTTANKDISIYK